MIKIDRTKLILSVIAGIILTFALSFNSARFFFSSNDISIRNRDDISKLQTIDSNDIVEVVGTPNFLYTLETSTGDYYFSLKEYDFNIIIRSDTKIDSSSKIAFVGKAKKLSEVSGAERLIEKLNEPVPRSELEDAGFSDDQIAEIEEEATGEFDQNSYLVVFTSRNNDSTEIVLSELFFIFIFTTLGISSIVGGLKYSRDRSNSK